MEPMKHNFDGITELDNFLPRWWLWLFYITIVFAVGYFAYYQFLGGPTLKQELQAELSQYQQGSGTGGPSASEDELKGLLVDATRVSSGKGVFTTRCLACHGPGGEGTIGPNLTDEYWIHGKGKLQDIYAVIRDGVAAKGMPPWGPVLTADELKNVTVFVKTLKGTNPPNGKAPQGEKVTD